MPSVTLKYKKAKKYNKQTEAKKYYKSKVKNRPLENLGKVVGSYFGKTGTKVGKYLGRAAGIITGSGAYEIHKNSLMNQQVPFVHSSSEVVRIKHREFLGNINGSIGFNIQSFNVNPGLATTFPWLHNSADSFEQYKLEGCVVQFVSTAGNAISSTNNSLGTVCLATDYNVVNEDFVNMAQCQNSMWSNTAKPSENILMPIECDGKLNVLERLFIRSYETNLNNSDLRLYDHCKFYVATEGMQVSTQIGQLWICYDICLYKPVLKSNNLNTIVHYYNASPTNANPFGSIIKKFDNVGFTFSASQINIPNILLNKKIQITFMYYNPSGAVTNIFYPTLFFGNCTGNFILTNNTDAQVNAPETGLSTSSTIIVIELVITGLNAYISGWQTGTYPAGTPRLDLIINDMYE